MTITLHGLHCKDRRDDWGRYCLQSTKPGTRCIAEVVVRVDTQGLQAYRAQYAQHHFLEGLNLPEVEDNEAPVRSFG